MTGGGGDGGSRVAPCEWQLLEALVKGIACLVPSLHGGLWVAFSSSRSFSSLDILLVQGHKTPITQRPS